MNKLFTREGFKQWLWENWVEFSAQYKPHVIITGGRGSGRTTRAMLVAPHGAYYIHPGQSWYYAKLAASLGRDDLKITPMDRLLDNFWYCGLKSVEFRLDHACGPCMTEEQLEAFAVALEYADLIRGR